ncbi:hypothetical protein Nepgr_000678 [Nepenthes gracilis]|uniref:BZIP domain-containing protein n=1 Tax=Nepenthes gracilis TaxID=150966 RepID=A0AAD3P6U8_NEPGR|nr:hypothetical protein Nepgr_000678 [Nepenthes gracilis]
MNLTELLASQPTTVPKKSRGMDVGNGPLESCFGVVRGLNAKMADEVWREIQQGEKMKNGDVVVKTERKPTLGEMALEDFLVKEGSFAESSLGPVDAVTPQNYTQQMSLSPAPSLGARSDTPMSGRKRDTSDAIERSIERKLRRKIKNRESAARSRARKQAYHNELLSKVSRLEVENMMLKKEKELENISPDGPADEPRYQLRRTTSASF